jgi:alpha/beta superfamily hydrolase
MHETEVAIPSGDISLAGVFVAPEGPQPYRTALLIAGSGPLDRDGSIKKIPLGLSLDLAAVLAENGWASLRFDKRGVGASGGDYLSTGFYGELADVQAATAWLQDRDDVGTIVAIGHSVGATMAVELGARDSGIDGAVLLAYTAKTGEETLSWQTAQIGDNLVPGPIKSVMRLFGTSVQKQQQKAVRKLKATTTDVARVQLVKVNAKWMREFIAYDPIPVLQEASLPLVAITGSKDVQVDPADLPVIETTAPDAQAQLIEDVDHILRLEQAAFSNPRHYGKKIKQPIDPRVLSTVTGWLDERWPSDDGARSPLR